MTATDDRIAQALGSAMEDLEFMLDAASIDFDILDSPNINQYIIAFAEGGVAPTSPPNSRGTISPSF